MGYVLFNNKNSLILILIEFNRKNKIGKLKKLLSLFFFTEIIS